MTGFTRFRFGRRALAGAVAAAAMLVGTAGAIVPTTIEPAGAEADGWRGPAAEARRPFRPTLPAPTGRFEVGRTTLHLVDSDRRDPWNPGRRRELMATVTYPARHTDRYPRGRWFSSAVAADLDAQATQAPYDIPAGSVDFAGARAHARAGAPVARPPSSHRDRGRDRDRGWPVVLFSPGFGTPRELNTALLEDLASRGYIVVSVDPTYETLVEFPGGRVVPPDPDTASSDFGVLRTVFKRAIDVRVADTRFVLDELTSLDRGRNPDAEHRRLPVGLRRSLDLSDVGMLGYSYGGYTAAESMYNDQRIDAGINLDGAMAHGIGISDEWPYEPGAAVRNGLRRPFLLFGQQGHDHLGPIPDEPAEVSWPEFWANQRGWKLDITLRNGKHGSFSDLQTLLPQIYDALDRPLDGVAPLIGTIDPDRSIAAQRAYIGVFFDLHVRDRDVHLLDGPTRSYPEIQFIR